MQLTQRAISLQQCVLLRLKTRSSSPSVKPFLNSLHRSLATFRRTQTMESVVLCLLHIASSMTRTSSYMLTGCASSITKTSSYPFTFASSPQTQSPVPNNGGY
ncbi:hypothetical protein EV2_008480 [Malus domestica]